MMKFRKMMFAGLALTMLTACSQDDDLTGNGANGAGEGDAYMALSIAMPNNGMGGRAISNNTGDNGSQQAGTNAGTPGEQEVKTITVYVWGEDNVVKFAHTFPVDKLTHSGSSYTTPQFSLKGGKSKVVAVVNGGDKFTADQINGHVVTPAAMRQAIDLGSDAKNIVDMWSQPGNFIMTNANTICSQNAETGADIPYTTPSADNQFGTDGTVYVNVNGTKAQPTKVEVPVERILAKIEEISEKLSFDVIGEKGIVTGDKVEFTDVALINGNTKFYPIKHVRAQHANNIHNGKVPDANNDYIVDPNFEKEKTVIGDFYAREFTAGKGIKWCPLSASKHFTTYTLENTMICTNQMNYCTTGLYYKAKYMIDGKAGHVYSYNGLLYNWASLSTLVDENKQSIVGNLTEKNSVDEFKKKNITKYEDGVCYYPYWIRHVPSADDLAPMEFGVVRNNWYQMTLNSVRGIGSHDPIDPETNNPDEVVETQLEVVVKVLPWVVRKNQIDF